MNGIWQNRLGVHRSEMEFKLEIFIPRDQNFLDGVFNYKENVIKIEIYSYISHPCSCL
jgi:hypothetical protein